MAIQTNKYQQRNENSVKKVWKRGEMFICRNSGKILKTILSTVHLFYEPIFFTLVVKLLPVNA